MAKFGGKRAAPFGAKSSKNDKPEYRGDKRDPQSAPNTPQPKKKKGK